MRQGPKIHACVHLRSEYKRVCAQDPAVTQQVKSLTYLEVLSAHVIKPAPPSDRLRLLYFLSKAKLCQNTDVHPEAQPSESKDWHLHFNVRCILESVSN